MPDEKNASLAVLIDDDDNENFVNTRMIRKAGLVDDIISFENPVKAVAYLERTDRPTVDLLIVDINMPEMSGFEVLDRHRALPREQQARRVVMLLTSSLNPTDVERARGYPEIVYSNKPLVTDSLFEIWEKRGDDGPEN